MPEWRSCSFNIESEALQYFCYVIFNFITVAFCMVQLYNNHSCETTSIYMPLLTMCVGSLVPTPRISSRKRDSKRDENEDESDEGFAET